MVRVNKSSKKKPQPASLVCARAKSGAGCEYVSVRYELVEAALVRNAQALVDNVPVGDAAVAGLDRELDGWDIQIGNLKDTLELLAVELQDPAMASSTTLRSRIRQLEWELAEAEAHHRELLEQKVAAMSPVATNGLEELKEALGAKKLDRGAINPLLRQIVAMVTVDYSRGTLAIRWRHNGDTTEIGYGMSREGAK